MEESNNSQIRLSEPDRTILTNIVRGLAELSEKIAILNGEIGNLAKKLEER